MELLFAVLAIITILIFIPFTMELQKLQKHLNDNQPFGYYWPEITELWFALFTGIIFVVIEKIVDKLFYPCFYQICKE
jgi:hypothetical protein